VSDGQEVRRFEVGQEIETIKSCNLMGFEKGERGKIVSMDGDGDFRVDLGRDNPTMVQPDEARIISPASPAPPTSDQVQGPTYATPAPEGWMPVVGEEVRVVGKNVANINCAPLGTVAHITRIKEITNSIQLDTCSSEWFKAKSLRPINQVKIEKNVVLQKKIRKPYRCQHLDLIERRDGGFICQEGKVIKCGVKFDELPLDGLQRMVKGRDGRLRCEACQDAMTRSDGQ